MIHQTAFQKVVALQDLADDLHAEIKHLRQRAELAEAERDAEIARVVRLTERLGTETLRADRADFILAALREPSEALVEETAYAMACALAMRWAARGTIRAAVAAAEKEVNA